MIDAERNRRLCLHPDYDHRTDPEAHDDREFRDEWQDGVYRAAWRHAVERGYHRIADFGCGSAFKLTKYFSRFDTTGYEIEPTLGFLREKYPDRRWCDGAAVESFDADLLICADVLEHLADPLALLQKVRRSPVAVVFLSTPSLEMLAGRGKSFRLGPPDNKSHINEWATDEFRNLAQSAGFRLLEQSIVSLEQGTQLIIAS